ncbi:MAG: phosphoribosylformylglycinamidine synthase subunit PurS [Promethearchaeota archaeon]
MSAKDDKMDLIVEGKVKKVYQDPDSDDRVIIEFTDSVTAGDGKKRSEFKGKGDLTSGMSQYLLGFLEGKGVDTHFLKTLDGPRIQCRKVKVFPIEVVCRNIAAGSFCKRYGIEKGKILDEPLVEFFLKNDNLHDPPISQDAIRLISLVSEENINFMKSVTLSVNHYVSELLKQSNLTLVDFKLEFGETSAGHIVVADELSGDTMRVWDSDLASLDKDVFREDTGDLLEVYTRLLDSIKKAKTEEVPKRVETVLVLVKPKSGIKNPPGEVTKKALIRLGFGEVEDVRVGKAFNIILHRPITTEILNHMKIMNIKLLSNPIAENHEVKLN